jgi:hypothetical protein
MDGYLAFDRVEIRRLFITSILRSRVSADYSTPDRFSKNVRRIIILKCPGP